jgi:HupE / UreJ protein
LQARLGSKIVAGNAASPLRRWPRPALLVTALLALAATADAHNLTFTDVRLELRVDGFFRADVVCDLDALALGVESGADSVALAAAIEAMAPAQRDALVARLEEMLERRLRVRFDGEPAALEVSLPERGQARPEGSLPSALGLVARLEGRVPAGAREVSFFASRAFPPVRLEIVDEGGRRLHVQILQRGAESTPARVAGDSDLTRGATLRRFVALGFEHILPEGLDHVLFVVGLALFSRRIGPLLVQVTAFTLAHTVTLILSTYGVVQLPSRVVEPLIALSIAYVAVENLLTSELRFSRVLLVFGFGLLHGLGFAGVLAELGLPQRNRLVALLAFNGGVELGQLAVILPVWLFLRVLERLSVSRRTVVVPASLLIAAIGIYWTATRLIG